MEVKRDESSPLVRLLCVAQQLDKSSGIFGGVYVGTLIFAKFCHYLTMIYYLIRRWLKKLPRSVSGVASLKRLLVIFVCMCLK